MEYHIIVAASENNVIGKGNQMPWHLPDDLKFFKKTTLGFPIIMGKNTWHSIGGKALPKRLNIVLSKSLRPHEVEGAALFTNFQDVEDHLKEQQYSQAFIIGGGEIYKEMLPKVQSVYLTRVHTTIADGEVFFPELKADEWELQESTSHSADEQHLYAFTFEHWKRVF